MYLFSEESSSLVERGAAWGSLRGSGQGWRRNTFPSPNHVPEGRAVQGDATGGPRHCGGGVAGGDGGQEDYV